MAMVAPMNGEVISGGRDTELNKLSYTFHSLTFQCGGGHHFPFNVLECFVRNRVTMLRNVISLISSSLGRGRYVLI